MRLCTILLNIWILFSWGLLPFLSRRSDEGLLAELDEQSSAVLE